MPGFKKGDKRAMLDSDMIGLPKNVQAENKRILANASAGPLYSESNFRNKTVDVLKKKFNK